MIASREGPVLVVIEERDREREEGMELLWHGFQMNCFLSLEATAKGDFKRFCRPTDDTRERD